MRSRRYLYDLVMILAGAITIGFDQWSKAAIRQRFPCDGTGYTPLFGQYFGLTCDYNTGAAFSIFNQGNKALLFLFIGLALAVVIWLYIRFASQPSLLLKISFGMILGGAAGNLIDRFRLGYVTDFLLFTVKSFVWPVFNLADSAICIGIFLLMLYLWRRPGQAKRSSVTGATNSPTTKEKPAEHTSTQ